MAAASAASGDAPCRETEAAFAAQRRFACGLAAGLLVTGTFNPWDRALYLSVVHRRRFLARDNWREPYRGVLQTLAQRSLATGFYFPLEEFFSSATGSPLVGGQLAGVANGALLNPIALVKYQSWGADGYRSFPATIMSLYRLAGPLVFLRGVIATSLRDGTFGFFFSLRKRVPIDEEDRLGKFAVGTALAAVGTVFSSPFNYLRNLSYAASPTVNIETLHSKRGFVEASLRDLAIEVLAQRTLVARFLIVQERFRLGWGTARVAVGMALTDQVYRCCCQALGCGPA